MTTDAGFIVGPAGMIRTADGVIAVYDQINERWMFASAGDRWSQAGPGFYVNSVTAGQSHVVVVRSDDNRVFSAPLSAGGRRIGEFSDTGETATSVFYDGCTVIVEALRTGPGQPTTWFDLFPSKDDCRVTYSWTSKRWSLRLQSSGDDVTWNVRRSTLYSAVLHGAIGCRSAVSVALTNKANPDGYEITVLGPGRRSWSTSVAWDPEPPADGFGSFNLALAGPELLQLAYDPSGFIEVRAFRLSDSC